MVYKSLVNLERSSERVLSFSHMIWRSAIENVPSTHVFVCQVLSLRSSVGLGQDDL